MNYYKYVNYTERICINSSVLYLRCETLIFFIISPRSPRLIILAEDRVKPLNAPAPKSLATFGGRWQQLLGEDG